MIDNIDPATDKSSTVDLTDADLPTSEGLPERIGGGEYDAICYDVVVRRSFGGQKKCFVYFRIHGGRYDGVELFMACNYSKKPHYSSKYFEQWSIANGAPPMRKDRMSPRIFKNKMFRVLVVKTQRKFSNALLKPDYLQHSIIETILERLA